MVILMLACFILLNRYYEILLNNNKLNNVKVNKQNLLRIG